MRKTFRRTLFAAVALSLLGLTACEQMDPLTKSYVWKPTNANAANIAAMAANPADLIVGRDSRSRRVVVESESIERVWTDKPRPLLTGGGGAGAGAGAGASAPAGGGP